ncbi:carboxymuconolactone decarboxylase family protein [Pseudonocardia kujensis]|uniref:carboxymuconolactone decarboxylase family protein n=1 Tax=Pseudonocardia kujensis TaxID=1128675 RepID=UPI001E4482F7|nr:carboxymuconolactone decarboxylase family protein [Pseudonocardia kujensis]MCE0764204.1 carboxymuconolactone decarboxylase family protein [Pseudonocardia kujensis]
MTPISNGITAEDVLARIREDRGHHPEVFEVAARFDPQALLDFHASHQHAMGPGTSLSEPVRQLVLLALDAAAHFHGGCRFHMLEALRAGVEPEQIVETLRLTGLTGGYHVPLVAYPLLAEALAEFEAECPTGP